jgi:hypothetical protein
MEPPPRQRYGLRVRPLRFRVKDARKPLHDFYRLGGGLVVAREDACRALKASGIGGFLEREVTFEKRVRTPEGKVSKVGVASPLVELVLEGVDPDIERSSTRIEIVDGKPHRLFVGHEEWHGKYDLATKKCINWSVPREPGKGRVFWQQAVGDRDIFIETVTGVVMCTDRFKEAVESHNFWGLSFLEMGDILSADGM